MATRKSRPSRALNGDVSFDLDRFGRELFEALDPSGLTGRGSAPKIPGGGDFSIDWLSCSPSVFGVNYLLSEMFSKFDDGKPSEAKRIATWEKFIMAERECLITNKRLSWKISPVHIESAGVHSVLHVAQRKISSILGDFSWDEAFEGFGFGPGATFSLPRRMSDAVYKFDGPAVTTVGNLAAVQAILTACPLWQESVNSHKHPVHLVRGNKVCTVPKNYKTDRTIAIEPDMNIFVQKGIGRMIRRRLARQGIDLNSQRENQDMALLGSIFDNLATVDMSMASDTVSYELVADLVPEPWLAALEQCRSPEGVLPSGEWITYQKFSSMGNGYTFELESLIFYALASAVIEVLELKDRRIAVFGDDVIINSEAIPLFRQVLAYCGFKFNDKKSFVEGPFRESCGKHYFSGYDVTPFYVRRPIRKLMDLFLLHNNLYRWCARNQWNTLWDREKVNRLLLRLRGYAPNNWRRPRIPDGYGDGAFIGTFDQCLPRVPKGKRSTWEGFEVEVLQEVQVSRESERPGRLLKSLFFLETRSDSHLSYLSNQEWSGGVSLNPKVRVVTTLVQQYPGVHPCIAQG